MITISAAVEEYLILKEAGRRVPGTIRWYAAMLKPLIAEFGERPADGLQRLELAKWLIVQNKPSAANTSRDRDTALRAFWTWVAKEYGCQNPMKGIPVPKRPDPQPRAISVDDLNALLEACENQRDLAIFLTIADCGLRAAEVVHLTIQDVDFAHRTLRVVGKGDRVRSTPFSHDTELALSLWFKRRPRTGDALFCRADGQALTYWGLRQMARRAAERAGFENEICNLHSLRHFAAIGYLRNGGTLPAISRILGHKSITTTAHHYTVYADSELSELHDAHTALKSLKAKEGI